MDILELRAFYHTPLGRMTATKLTKAVGEIWHGFLYPLEQSAPKEQNPPPPARRIPEGTYLSIGYPLPLFGSLPEKTKEKMLVFMPSAQGAVHWPNTPITSPEAPSSEGKHTLPPSQTALVDLAALPLADQSVTRIIALHALEHSESTKDVLAELWRVLAPNGRMILFVPNRLGLWARTDHTPFGHGRPFSKRQIFKALKEAHFTLEHYQEALYFPPINYQILLKSAPLWAKIGAYLPLNLAGVHVIEVCKSLHHPVLTRSRVPFSARLRPFLLPAPAPSGKLPSEHV
jgi:SAM-dependent methyltransferase